MKIKKWRLDDTTEPIIVSMAIDRKDIREMVEGLLDALEKGTKEISLTFTLEQNEK